MNRRRSSTRQPRERSVNRILAVLTTDFPTEVGKYYWTNSALSEMLNIPRGTTSGIMKEMVVSGLVEVVEQTGRGGKRYYKVAA